MSSPIPSHPAALNLRRLLVLRNIVLAGQLLAIGAAVYRLDMALPLLPVGIIISAYASLSILTGLRLRWPRPVTDAELYVQLLLDVAALTGLLYFLGGSTNPFVSFFLLPLMISAAALPATYTWVMAAVTIACYSVLMFFYMPLPHTSDNVFALHVLGMWCGFVLTAGLIAYFVVNIGVTLRARDHALAAAREDALRNERILALGTLAAGAAHELGTPLSTMAVLLKELERDVSGSPHVSGVPGVVNKLHILREQIQRCKATLSTLSASAGQAACEAGRGLPLDRYLDEIVNQWRRTRTAVDIQPRWTGIQPAPIILAEQTLSQAIMIILNNAADACPRNIEVDGHWTHEQLFLEVRDQGAGFTAEAVSAAGNKLFTTKEPGQGLGLGLFLAHAAIRRFGGKVQLFNRDSGGTCTRLLLPLSQISAAA